MSDELNYQCQNGETLKIMEAHRGYYWKRQSIPFEIKLSARNYMRGVKGENFTREQLQTYLEAFAVLETEKHLNATYRRQF